ncbi:MAG: gliding motility-associated C-terminal domain-containing protein [Sphingobacteriaceae bacterium]|nr:MAG: gliding motility-associated C-terminal domain-containing protein [Sphingobacteriaceae bacterium]
MRYLIRLLLFIFCLLQVTVAKAQVQCVEFDLSKMLIKLPDCGVSNASVTGITATGAVSFKWIDDFGNTVSTALNLGEVGPGSYELIGITGTGCQNSTLINISADGTPLPAYNVYGINTSCGAANGSFHIEVKNLPDPDGIRWVNAANETVGTEADTYNLPNGTYRLYMRNAEGCEVLYTTATLQSIQPFSVSFENSVVVNDVCSQGLGGVNGIVIKSGVAPFNTVWRNQKGDVVGNEIELKNVGAGNYSLTITDRCGSEIFTRNYEISNDMMQLNAPLLADVKLCSPDRIWLAVFEAKKTGSYRFYDSKNAFIPLAENTSGVYEVMVERDIKLYVSHRLGDCESERTEVNITLGISSELLPNTITPNGDGINDKWDLSWLRYFPNPSVQIYNRIGQSIYTFNKNKMYFDGSSSGKPLPVGVYYYIIEPGNNCKRISGIINIIR